MSRQRIRATLGLQSWHAKVLAENPSIIFSSKIDYLQCWQLMPAGQCTTLGELYARKVALQIPYTWLGECICPFVLIRPI